MILSQIRHSDARDTENYINSIVSNYQSRWPKIDTLLLGTLTKPRLIIELQILQPISLFYSQTCNYTNCFDAQSKMDTGLDSVMSTARLSMKES